MQRKKHFLSMVLLSLVFIAGCKEKENIAPQNMLPLHAVKGNEAGIYDSQGRFVMLRGVNYNVLGDYWQANPSVPATKAYSKEDFRMMASYGFNCVRLIFSWSKLQPAQGVIDENYIQAITKVIEDAAEAGLYVVLDMHQDAWGKYIATPPDSACTHPNKGWDGAPLWATITNGASTCSPDGRRESAPAVVHAFQNFWDNTGGIRNECINAWKHLVEATASFNNVAGYDLINEPSLGYKSPKEAEAAKMEHFYDTLIRVIRSAENGANRIIFFEQAIQWNGLEQLYLPSSSFTADQNIIFSPHAYFEAIGNTPFTIEEGINFLLIGSKFIYSTGLFIGEWGFFGNPANDVSKVKRFAIMEDSVFASSAWWQWCQSPGDPHGMSWDGNSYSPTSLHLIELDDHANFTGNVNEIYLKVLSRARPLAISGQAVIFRSNPDNGVMHLEAKTENQGTTEIWIPSRTGTPVITGQNIILDELRTVAGGYIAIISVNGEYKVDITY